MIRIDEIYNNTFWPYIQEHIPFTRMLYCYPYGSTDPKDLTNFKIGKEQTNYIFFHDQEPIHLDIHNKLFFKVTRINQDLNPGGQQGIPIRTDRIAGTRHRAIITSECDSDAVDQVCSLYEWQPYYYFFHGWAALDWYRGYNRSFLIPNEYDRKITKSFISPNRIIGGKRKHRVELMYHLLKKGIDRACISFPNICPAENISIFDISNEFLQYPDMQEVFAKAELPWNFQGEKEHPMHSCWLSLFEQSAESLAYVVTETVFEGRRHHLTEKTFKPICMKMPFILASTAGSLKYLKSYGFQTFENLWDESYDQEVNDEKRLLMIADLLKDLDSMTNEQQQNLYIKAIPVIQHNYNHFYNGGFEQILWDELISMLAALSRDFGV
jgi:predicted XRE-type DNA-binding protein